MIDKETDHNRFIYHYTKLETAEEYIIPDGTIRLSQYTQTNDPKETRDWVFKLGRNSNGDLSEYSIEGLSKWLSSELKEHTNLACFCKDQSELTGNNFKDLYKRGYVKPRMWAQYADNHNGVCLIFDKEKLIHEVEQQIHSQDNLVYGDINYHDESPIPNFNTPQHFIINIDILESVGKQEYVLRHLSTYYKELFFQKLLDWNNESEWRCIVFTSDSSNIDINFKNSLVGIVYGDSLQNNEVQRLMCLSKKYNLEHLGLKWNNSFPWYDYRNPVYLGL